MSDADRCQLHCGDCLEVMRGMAADSLDACVTDPPYGLEFMGNNWDRGVPGVPYWAEILRILKPGAHLVSFGGTRTYHRLVCAIEDAGFEIRDQLQWLYGTGLPKSRNLDGEWEGWGTALKPAFEPIVLARKPLSEGTVAANVLRWRTGALNIDTTRIGSGDDRTSGGATGKRRGADEGYSGSWSDAAEGRERPTGGRWPANVVHDGSAEVIEAFPNAKGAVSNGRKGKQGLYEDGIGAAPQRAGYADDGSAARFFYSAKASKADRAGSKHPTVKPVSLMQWLCRLVTPPGGVVLDPFAGSGTTGSAAMLEGFSAVLIEQQAEYFADIQERILNQPLRLAV